MRTILQSFDTYFVRVNDDNSWDEVYDPRVATVFNSNTLATKWGVENTTMHGYFKCISGKDIDLAIEEFMLWVEGGMVRRSFDTMNKTYNINFDPKKHSTADVLRWNYAHAKFGDDLMVHQDIYSQWNGAMYNLFSFIHSINGYYSEDYTETFVGAEIKVNSDSEFEDFKEELDLLLDTCDLTKKVDGATYISVFEHDLCETRSIALLMHSREKDKWSVVSTRYSTDYILKKVSLKECFNRLRTDYWYD